MQIKAISELTTFEFSKNGELPEKGNSKIIDSKLIDENNSILLEISQHQNNKYTSKNINLSKLLIELYKTIGELNTKIYNLSVTHNKDKTDLLNKINSLKSRMTTAERDIDALKSRMTTAERDIDALEGRMTTAERDIDALEGRMTTAERDIDALSKKHIRDIGVLNGRIDSIETTHEEYMADINENYLHKSKPETQTVAGKITFAQVIDGTITHALSANIATQAKWS